MKNLKLLIRCILRIFFVFPVNNRKIFFMSFNGTKIGFDSKAFIDWLEENNHGGEFSYIWGVDSYLNQRLMSNEKIKCVKIKSFKGIYHIITSRILMYNINPPSYIPYRKNQILINTWHSFSYKKVGKYAKNFDEKQFNTTNCFLSHSKSYSKMILNDSFNYYGKILECGVPRNDIFFSNKYDSVRNKVKKLYGISNKKIIMYAPTFRGDFIKEDFDINFKKLKQILGRKFGGDWVIFYRLHPMIANKYKLKNSEVIDVSLYPDMQELLCATDILISDYSGSMWDFSLKKKPVILYAPDSESYKDDRGMYISCEKLPFIFCKNINEIYSSINNFNSDKYLKNINKYLETMGSFEKGYASEKVYNYISMQIRGK